MKTKSITFVRLWAPYCKPAAESCHVEFMKRKHAQSNLSRIYAGVIFEKQLNLFSGRKKKKVCLTAEKIAVKRARPLYNEPSARNSYNHSTPTGAKRIA